MGAALIGVSRGKMPVRAEAFPYLQALATEPLRGSPAWDAIALGRLIDQRGASARMFYGGDQHTLIFGPNGKGKGSRFLIPNLLRMCGASVVAVDPKGELAAVTAPFRRLLGRVVILNPFGVHLARGAYSDLESHGFNPLAALDPSARSFNAQAAQFSDALITVDPKDPHWGQSARALIAALVMYTVIEAREAGRVPSMRRVRELLCEASDEAHAGNEYKGAGLPIRALEMMKSKLAGLRNKAAQFTSWSREVQSIASTARIQTESFDDDEIADDMDCDGFDFRQIKREPITVYVVLPPDKLERHAKWLRLVLTSAFQAVLRERLQGEPKTVFLLDEFFALGHLEIVSTTWALVRAYGIQVVPILQNMDMLKKLYGDMWESFIGMAGAVACFATNDLTTADWFSRRAGETERRTFSTSSSTSQNFSQGSSSGWNSGSSTSTGGSGSTGSSSGQSGGNNWGWSTSSSENRNESFVRTRLISPHKLMGLPSGHMLVTLDGVSNVLPVYAPDYREMPLLDRLARPNPLYG